MQIPFRLITSLATYVSNKDVRTNNFRSSEIEAKRTGKDIKLNLILHLQTRAKWYRAIKSKRYRPANRDESHASAELTHVTAQNQELKAVIQILMREFPQLTKNITKALNMLC